MAWSYSGDPSESPKDQVRFLIGDTDQRDPLLQDGEITWVISQYNSPMNAAIRCVETIIAKMSRLADERVGAVSLTFSQKAKGYRDLRADLVLRLASEGAIPYCGGISKSDNRIIENNPDRVKPEFRKHMMENDQIAPWTTEPVGGPFSEEDA